MNPDSIRDFLRTLDRPEPSRDFQEHVIRKIRSGACLPGRSPALRIAASVAAALILGFLGWKVLRIGGPREDVVALASDHARRATLALREIAKSEGHPAEALRQDYAVSGLAERSRRLASVTPDELPEETQRYVRDVLPRIASMDFGDRESARKLLEDRTLQDMAGRWNRIPGPVATSDTTGDPAMRAYVAGRAALYAGDLDTARASFQMTLQDHPKSRYREGAAYWLAQTSSAAGRTRDAAAAYYSLSGSSWLESADVAAIARIAQELRSAPESQVRVLAPRGGVELNVTSQELVQLLENARESSVDVVAIRPQLVTILVRSDGTILQGDLDARVLKAFQRIRSFYPRDVTVSPASVRLSASLEKELLKDESLKKEVEIIRRAIPLLWR